MLAFNKIAARLAAHGSESSLAVTESLSRDTGAMSEMIARGDFNGACTKADELAKRLGVDLKKEQSDMITIEQLTKDGGKGSGSCSVSDAAKKNMELHSLLQAEVTAGRKDAELFRQYGDDTKALGEMYATDPSKACDLLDKLKVKYGL